MTMTAAIHPLAIVRLTGALVFALFLSIALAQERAEPLPDERLNGLDCKPTMLDLLVKNGVGHLPFAPLQFRKLDPSALG